MIAIRPARPDDAAAIAAIYAPHVTEGVASFETEAPDTAEIARRMAASGGLYPWLVADDGAVVGYAYAGPYATRDAYRWAVELTIYIAPAAQGRGVGRKLYRALLDVSRRQGFTQAIARLALPSAGSIALHQALGFHHAGTMTGIGWKQGRWLDVGIWQCALAEPGAHPAQPQRALP